MELLHEDPVTAFDFDLAVMLRGIKKENEIMNSKRTGPPSEIEDEARKADKNYIDGQVQTIEVKLE